MDDLFIIFSSSTTANRIRKLALREGVRGMRVVQTPKSLSKGCSYSLRCHKVDFPVIEQIAAEYGVNLDRIFTETVNEVGKKTYEMLL